MKRIFKVNQELAINLDRVSHIFADKDGCAVIKLVDEPAIYTMDDFKQVMADIQNMESANR